MFLEGEYGHAYTGIPAIQVSFNANQVEHDSNLYRVIASGYNLATYSRQTKKKRFLSELLYTVIYGIMQ
jgi:hypothetical protein